MTKTTIKSAPQRETEIKCMIEPQTYERIRNLFEWDWEKEQINSYYSDSAGLLRKNGITFRVRTKDGKNKIQIKKHTKTNGALQISEETEFETDSIPESFCAAEVEKMTGIACQVRLLGSLLTTRSSKTFGSTEICLDKNEYLGVVDYEIELEYIGNVEKELTDILAKEGVLFSEKANGKCSRFMKRLSQIIQSTHQ